MKLQIGDFRLQIELQIADWIVDVRAAQSAIQSAI
jgi:hypothetical protein